MVNGQGPRIGLGRPSSFLTAIRAARIEAEQREKFPLAPFSPKKLKPGEFTRDLRGPGFIQQLPTKPSRQGLQPDGTFISSTGHSLSVIDTRRSTSDLRERLRVSSGAEAQALRELLISRQPSRAIIAKEEVVGGQVVRTVGVTQAARPPLALVDKPKATVAEQRLIDARKQDVTRQLQPSEAAQDILRVQEPSFFIPDDNKRGFIPGSDAADITLFAGRDTGAQQFALTPEQQVIQTLVTQQPERTREDIIREKQQKEFEGQPDQFRVNILTAGGQTRVKERLIGTSRFVEEAFTPVVGEGAAFGLATVTLPFSVVEGTAEIVGGGLIESIFSRGMVLDVPGVVTISRGTGAELVAFGSAFVALSAPSAIARTTASTVSRVPSVLGQRGAVRITGKESKLFRKELKAFQKAERVAKGKERLAQPPKPLFDQRFSKVQKNLRKEQRQLEKFSQSQLRQQIKLPGKGEAQRFRVETKRISAVETRPLPKVVRDLPAAQRTREIGRTQRSRLRSGAELLTARELRTVKAPKSLFKETFKKASKRDLLQSKRFEKVFKSKGKPVPETPKRFVKRLEKAERESQFAGIGTARSLEEVAERAKKLAPRLRTIQPELSRELPSRQVRQVIEIKQRFTPGSAQDLGAKAGDRLRDLALRKQRGKFAEVEVSDVKVLPKETVKVLPKETVKPGALPRVDLKASQQQFNAQKVTPQNETVTGVAEIVRPAEIGKLAEVDISVTDNPTISVIETTKTKLPTRESRRRRPFPSFRPTPEITPRPRPKPTPSGRPTPEPTPGKPKIPKLPIIPIPVTSTPKGLLEGRTEQGYDVFGKQKGKNVKLNTVPLPESSALRLLANELDSTTAASGRIHKRGKAASHSVSLMPDLRKFKITKGRDSTRLVEKNKFRIDTPGEVMGIPLEAARLRRAGLLPSKKQKKILVM